MRPGPARGDSETIEFVVAEGMTATVGGREIHPIYGTGALVAHIEEVCRAMIEPHLEPDEEGVGYRIEAVHVSPATVGTKLTVTATVADIGPRRLLCEIAVRDGTRLVANGSFEQRVVDRDVFAAQVTPSTASG